METKLKTPILKTLGADYAGAWNQLTPAGPLSNGQPGLIQHAGLTKREYFAALFMAAELNNDSLQNLTYIDIQRVIKLTDNFIKALNDPD